MEIFCAIIGTYNPLSEDLVKKIISRGSGVIIVTKDDKQWNSRLNVQERKKVIIVDDLKYIPGSVKYLFIFDIFKLPFRKNTLLQYAKLTASKVIFISSYRSKQERFDYPVKTILLGELFGDGQESLFMKIVKDLACGKPLSVPSQDFPIVITDADSVTDYILHESFSYDQEGRVLIGTTLYYYALISFLRSLNPEINTRKSHFLKGPKVPSIDRNIELPFLTPNRAKELLDLFKPKGEFYLKPIRPKIKKIHVTKKRLAFFGTFNLFLLLLIFPFLLLSFSAVLLFASYKIAATGALYRANKIVDVSQYITAKSSSYFLDLKSFPLVGAVYGRGYANSKILYLTGTVFSDALESGLSAKDIFTNSLSGNDYNFQTTSQNLSRDLSNLYEDLSFFENEVMQSNTLIAKLIPQKQSIPELRKLVYTASRLGKSLPTLLGAYDTKSYMVLFQNNMELRPTGGFIGSFAIITFRNGLLIDQTVFDVYSADGQLKGYVAPPVPIRDYLGEASWYMRDANWDPDFPTSAKRVSWFLDKSLDRQVDGVVGIDLEFVKSLLGVTGPLKLADYQDEVNKNNLYEKVQNEVEGSFFPGSQKKATYLTALSKALITKTTDIGKDKYLDILKIAFTGLNSRDIQFYSSEPSIYDTFSELGWDGSIVPTTKCLGNCDVNWFSIIEANLGVNKSNYYISRNANLTTNIKGNSVNNALTLKITNTARRGSSIPETRYKNYIRLVAPKGAKVDRVRIVGEKESNYLYPDITTFDDKIEAGVLLDLLPAQTTTLVFNWTTSLNVNASLPGTVILNWRRQPGVPSFPVSVAINNLNSLTKGQVLGYNTDLSLDIIKKLTW